MTAISKEHAEACDRARERAPVRSAPLYPEAHIEEALLQLELGGVSTHVREAIWELTRVRRDEINNAEFDRKFAESQS